MTPSTSDPVRLLAAVDPVAAFADLTDDATFVVPTSGSTGSGREIVRTAGSWRAAFAAVRELTGLTPRSRVWCPGPLSATMNLYAAVHAAWAGADRVDGLATATHVHLTPAGLSRLLDPDESSGLLAGRTVVVAGDGLAPGLRGEAEAAGARVRHYYGAAELSFVAWGRDRDDLRPFPGVEVEIRAGEIWARSAGLAEGYRGAADPEGVAGPLRVDGRGFATVGDRGRFGGDGRLEVLGRPGSITTGGATLATAEIEAALRLRAHGELAVVGLPHPGLGQVVVAVLTDPDDRARMSDLALGAARPRRWFVRPQLPLTAAGKLDRQALTDDLVGELTGAIGE